MRSRPRAISVRLSRSISHAPKVSSRSSLARSMSTAGAACNGCAAASTMRSNSAARSTVQAPVAASATLVPSAVASSAAALISACSVRRPGRCTGLESAGQSQSYCSLHGALRPDRALAAWPARSRSAAAARPRRSWWWPNSAMGFTAAAENPSPTHATAKLRTVLWQPSKRCVRRYSGALTALPSSARCPPVLPVMHSIVLTGTLTRSKKAAGRTN